MKKIFTLTMLLVLAMTVNAQETYRKSWDFTKWSATTVANLVSGSDWTDLEKDGASTAEISKNNCYWENPHHGSAEGIELTANGELIAETAGLLFTNTHDRSLAIAVNYGDCTSANGEGFGPYHGASYLWLGSKGKNYFIIQHVAPGTTIKIGVESHKLTAARGVELYVGHGNSGTKLSGPDGNAVTAPTTYQDQEWLLPAEGLTDTPNEDGTFDITVRNTDGCHLYYITVGEGDSPAVEEAKKVAYLTPAGADLDADFAYIYMSGSDGIELTQVDVATATLESLAEYEAAVVASSVTAADADKVKALIAYFPVVNLSSDIYAAMGYGNAVATEATSLTIADASNAIFEGIDELAYEGTITGVELGDYFKADAVLAKAGETVAVHAHNAGRNAYYFIPTANAGSESAVFQTLIPQTVLAAAKTKRDITAVGTPAITFKQEDGASIVTITATNSNAIYYTIDGTDPTTTSTLYAEPFTLTAAATVKAFATGDGYTDSQIASKEVTIAHQAAVPTITVAREAGKSTVTLTGAEGSDIYFNFTKSEKQNESQKYSEPIELTEPATITFFAAASDGLLQSETAQQFVGIDGIDSSNIRWDVLAHMDGSSAEWGTVGSEESRSSKVNYMFGKSAKSMYTEEIESQETVKDSEGNDSIVYHYKKVDQTVVSNVSGTWNATSYGQVMTWESDGVNYPIGSAGRNPETAYDAMPVNDEQGITNQFLNFKGKASGEPYNATIQTASKYAGPFDIIVYLCNGDKNQNYPKINVEYSADGESWTKIDTLTTHAQRFIKRTKLSYEGTDEVYVRLAHVGGGSAGQVFNIYLMNNGEKSKQYSEEAVGIKTVQPEGNVIRTEVFTLGGARMAKSGRGVSIIRKTYANGAVVTSKAISK